MHSHNFSQKNIELLINERINENPLKNKRFFNDFQKRFFGKDLTNLNEKISDEKKIEIELKKVQNQKFNSIK